MKRFRNGLLVVGLILSFVVSGYAGTDRLGLSENVSTMIGNIAGNTPTDTVILRENVSVVQGKISGILYLNVTDGDGNLLHHIGPIQNTVVNSGETALRDCFGGTGTPTCTTVQNFKYHGIGTSGTAIGETDSGCLTELTTQYQTDNTRATGTQTNNGANVYRTVATNTVDASVTINEFCLMSQAAVGGGTMWTRILIGPYSLVSGNTITTTYDLTIE